MVRIDMPHSRTRDVEENDLRAAIFANPDDDAPRRVYADWLLERGDPRGEFILIQCMLGRTLSARGPLHRNHPAGRTVRPVAADPAAIPRLELREQALLREHQKKWILPIRKYVNSWFWERGFVSRVDVNIKKFVAHAGAILDFTPLVAVYAMGCTPQGVRQFAELPRVGSLRSLTFCMQRIGAREAEIFRSSRFANLRELTLQQNPLGDDAVRVLAGSTTLSALRMLDLSFSEDKITSRGVESLAAAEFFPRLTHLDLNCSLANRTAIEPILKRGASLQVLALGAQRLTKQEAAARAARGLNEPHD